MAQPDVLDRICDAIFDDGAFAELAGLVGSELDCEHAMVSIRHGRAIQAMSMTGPQAESAEYRDYYWRIDPWTPGILSLPAGRFAYGDELAPTEQILRTEFYVDYARPMGVAAPMCGRLPIGPGADLMVAIAKSELGQTFDEISRVRLAELAGHLKRAMQIRRRIRDETVPLGLWSSALNSVAFGLGVVDQDARLLFANQAFEDIVRRGQGLHVAGGRVVSSLHPSVDQLARLVFEAAAQRRSGACLIPAPEGVPALWVIVAPAGPGGPVAGMGFPACAILGVGPAEARTGELADILRSLFGLSTGEADIVGALWDGASLREVEVRRGVKATTMKTQMESIYRKTGAANQRDLMRLLGQLPALRAPGR